MTIVVLTLASAYGLWLLDQRVSAVEARAIAAEAKARAVEDGYEAQRDAVLVAVRKVTAVIADEVQPALGTYREDSVRAAAIACYRAIETIENTEP